MFRSFVVLCIKLHPRENITEKKKNLKIYAKHVSSWLYAVNIKNDKVVTPKRVRQSVLQKLVLCTLRIEQSVPRHPQPTTSCSANEVPGTAMIVAMHTYGMQGWLTQEGLTLSSPPC